MRNTRVFVGIIIVALLLMGFVGYSLANKKDDTVTNMTPMTNSTNAQTNTPQRAANTVTIKDFSFQPASITVKKGDTVTWVNDDSATHQIKSVDEKFSSNNLSTGQQYQFTFQTPGTYNYICGIHPSMKAVVIVTE